MTDRAKAATLSPYDMLGGEEGVKRLAHAFYAAMARLPEVETIRKMHKDDLSDVEQKLFEFLSGWLGGPQLYYKRYGTVCLNKPHRPYAIGEAERDQWLLCMNTALDDIGASLEVRTLLEEPFRQIADVLRTR